MKPFNATNIENLKRIKRTLQRQKLKRIDAYRIQVCSWDIGKANSKLVEGSDVPIVIKD